MAKWMQTDPETGVLSLDYTQLTPGDMVGQDGRVGSCSKCERPGVFKNGKWIHRARIGLGIAKPYKKHEAYQVVDEACSET